MQNYCPELMYQGMIGNEQDCYNYYYEAISCMSNIPYEISEVVSL